MNAVCISREDNSSQEDELFVLNQCFCNSQVV